MNPFCVDVLIAPMRRTMPPSLMRHRLRVAYGAAVHQPSSPAPKHVKALGVAGVVEYETPSNDVKHWAFENVPPSATTVTPPAGVMSSRPLCAWHRSMGT